MTRLMILFLCFTITLLINLDVHAFDSLKAKKVQGKINIDGKNDEPTWQRSTWQPIDQLILGVSPSAEDFSGQFKVQWHEDYLYLLVEIVDDVLFDQYRDPLHLYWDDDCLEVFIDEDASGGNHQFNFNAFAYHVALDNQVVDIGPKTSDGRNNFVLLNHHIKSVWKQKHNSVIWELAIKIYDDSYQLENTKQQPIKLNVGKRIGFMLAYCDNDGSEQREHFIGSTFIKAIKGDKNLGYITADVFDKLQLVD